MVRNKQRLEDILRDDLKSKGRFGADVRLKVLGSRAPGNSETVRNTGYALGKYGAAKEEEYFYKRQREQLATLRKELKRQTCDYGQEVRKLQDIIEQNKKHIADLEKYFNQKREK